MRVVAEFVSAAVSLSEVEGLKPDVVLLSVGLPDMTGFEACRKILNLLPSTRIVFIGPGHIKQVMCKPSAKMGHLRGVGTPRV